MPHKNKFANKGQQPENVWTKNINTNENITKTNKKENAEEKFNEIHKKNIESVKKYVQDYVDSSSDEEDRSNKDIYGSIFKSYTGTQNEISKTQEFLENTFQSKSAVCLICIGTVKRADPIWTCKNCYSFFHLPCIQRWANDSMAQKRISHEQQEGYYNNQGLYIPKPILSVYWDCPKCRKEYQPNEIPRHYECFCTKEHNPPNHLWLIPHSCGEPCSKHLVPDCGHKCVLLCHPGPCPPCPQTINVSCKCNQSAKKTIRCSQKSWTCLKVCKLKLNCGIHACSEICHTKYECPPCKNKSKQKCLCGNRTKEVNCYENKWKCNKICNKNYSCGLHSCEQVCHSGECGFCPLGQPRTCPCGKNKTVAPCSETVAPCKETCQKMLDCGQHQCSQRCHLGACGDCMEIVKKSCKCGYITKEMACYKHFSCENKCKNLKSCNKHPCNRKCCDGQCPPCDKLCGRTLPCGKHKCKSLCHFGPCYPCDLKSSVKCRCGQTITEVTCGREKKTKPPKCKLPCKIPSKCHHENPHSCHQGECPTCMQICNLKNDTTNCEHLCLANCHDSVKIITKDKNFKPALPWDIPVDIVEIKKLPHPACEVKVPVTCIGGHETSFWPCSLSKPTSCGRQCNRKLKCGNHRCELLCHKVKNLQSTEQDVKCMSCDLGCTIPRPEGCIHPCKKPCHPAPCYPCQLSVKTSCHCGITQVYYKCHEYNNLTKSGEELAQFRESLLSCGQKCIKNYPCGHRCNSTCHSENCPNPESCTKKVKITCECRHKKKEVPCNLPDKALNCDQSCLLLKKKIEEEMVQKEKELKELEEARNREAMEEYEKKFGKRKHKERKRKVTIEEQSSNWKIYAASGFFVALAIVLYVIFK